MVAALKVLKAMPDIDPQSGLSARLFLGGDHRDLRHGPETPSAHDGKITGLIAYYPYCYDNVNSPARRLF